MREQVENGQRHRRPHPSLLAAARWAGELAVLVLLLLVDFELGARRVGPDPGFEELAGALTTAVVACVLAGLALARRLLPPRAAVAAALALSVVASIAALGAESLSLSLTESAALLVLTAWGVRGEPSARGAAVVGAGALVTALAAVLLRLDIELATVLLALLLWGCAIALGLVGRQARRRREQALQEHRRSERLELARELHDVVAHQVSGIVVQAQAAIAVAGRDPDRAAEAFAAIESAGGEALSGMRRMVGAIREEPGQEAPLSVPYGLGDLSGLIERFDPEGTRAVLRLEGGQTPLPPGVGETAYRVIREALTNVRRHAPEGTVEVLVRVEATQLLLEVVNDRAPVDRRGRDSTGFGLTGMAERVTALGGTLSAGPDGPGRWSVRATLPLGSTR